MEDQYGLPSELRHHHHHISALTHRNINPSSASSPPNPNTAFHHHHPFSIAPSFPLVSGGALVDHSHFSLYHHHHNHHDQLESGGGGGQLWINNNSGNNINNSNNVVGNIENNNVDGLMIGGEASNSNNNSRWPRQETLTLLEIRSRLNSKFKDTNQKAPLWDEISRIMAEEHGYQRSGKKCKEKFENLYKYYKKTKEGKAGRQDGKHYRFFRQLESIYGDTTQTQSSSLLLDVQYVGSRNNNSPYDHQSNSNRPTSIMNHDSLSFSINSTEFETSSSENNDEDLSAIAFKMNSSHQNKMKGAMLMSSGGRKSSTTSSTWKAKVEGFVDSQMKKIMATQETWMEKMLKSVIEKEEDRLAKEDHYRRQEAARFDQEFTEFWAKEKAWVESRDEALVVALRNLRGKQSSSTSTLELPSFPERIMSNMGRDNSYNTTSTTTSYQRWSEEEISSLIELRTMFEYNNNNNNVRESVWDEIASKMACLGFGRTANECREKWESVSLYVTMTSESKKKRREDYYKVIAPQPQQQGYYYNFCDGSQQQQALELKQEGNNSVMGLQLMDNNEGLDNSNNNNPSSSSTNVGASSQIHPNTNNFFHLLFGGENLWEKYGTLKLGKDKVNHL